MEPAACGGPSVGVKDDTVRVDDIVWDTYGWLPQGGPIDVQDQGFTLDQQLLLLGPVVNGGSGCTYLGGEQALDLAKYPNAPADMKALRAFVIDRKDYVELTAATRIVDATVAFDDASVGQELDAPFPDDSGEPRYYAPVTLQVQDTLCGGGSNGVLNVRYQGWVNAGLNNPAGSVPPVPGAHLVFLLGPRVDHLDLVAADYDIIGVFPGDQRARLAALLASPPALSL
jgi:hypothetical protein